MMNLKFEIDLWIRVCKYVLFSFSNIHFSHTNTHCSKRVDNSYYVCEMAD